MIDLYGGASPNAVKILIMLEELGRPYTIHDIKVFHGEQYAPEFLKLNPLGKYPVIVDHDGAGADQPIFESGAILIYLAETYAPALLPATGPARWEVLKWLMVQMAGVGPMFGQHVHFRVLPEEAEGYAGKRYRAQTGRLLQVLDGHLGDKEWLGGAAYSIADIATWPWVAMVPRLGFAWADFPALQAWYARIEARPAVQRALPIRDQLMGSFVSNGPRNAEDLDRFFLRKGGPAVDYSRLAPPEQAQ